MIRPREALDSRAAAELFASMDTTTGSKIGTFGKGDFCNAGQDFMVVAHQRSYVLKQVGDSTLDAD